MSTPTVAQCAPDPALSGPQNWEQPADAPRAKQLRGKMCGAKTKALCKEDAFPWAKISSVKQAHVEQSQLDKCVADDLIARGQTNTAHFLPPNKTDHGLPNEEMDKEAIQHKKACVTVARVMAHKWHNTWIKEN